VQKRAQEPEDGWVDLEEEPESDESKDGEAEGGETEERGRRPKRGR
jgi:hypothetical protein